MTEKVIMDDGRLRHLEERIGHTDVKVAEIGQGLSTLQSSQDVMAAAVNKIADKINAPTNTNWVGIIGAFCISLTLLGTGVKLLLDPPADRIIELQTLHVNQMEISIVQSHWRGNVETKLQQIWEQERHADERTHVLEARVQELEKKAERQDVVGEATGAYVKELRDEFKLHLSERHITENHTEEI